MAKDKQPNMKQLLLKELLDDSLTKSEITAAFKKIIEIVKDMRNKNKQEMEAINKKLYELVRKYVQDSNSGLDMTKAELRSLIDKEITRISQEHANKLGEVDYKISLVKDGKDADEKTIVKAVMGKLEYPTMDKIKEGLPVFGDAIRDALELLQGEERLEVSAINGLEERLEKLSETKASKKLGGGGFSYIAMDRHFVDDETPSGTINGTNKVFTIAKAPNPTASLKVYLDGQRMKSGGEDYTLSGTTITFGLAPLTGSKLTVDYRF